MRRGSACAADAQAITIAAMIQRTSTSTAASRAKGFNAGRSSGLRVDARLAPSRIAPVVMANALAAYSCGSSRGFEPRSLNRQIVLTGTLAARNQIGVSAWIAEV